MLAASYVAAFAASKTIIFLKPKDISVTSTPADIVILNGVMIYGNAGFL